MPEHAGLRLSRVTDRYPTGSGQRTAGALNDLLQRVQPERRKPSIEDRYNRRRRLDRPEQPRGLRTATLTPDRGLSKSRITRVHETGAGPLGPEPCQAAPVLNHDRRNLQVTQQPKDFLALITLFQAPAFPDGRTMGGPGSALL